MLGCWRLSREDADGSRWPQGLWLSLGDAEIREVEVKVKGTCFCTHRYFQASKHNQGDHWAGVPLKLERCDGSYPLWAVCLFQCGL